MNKYWVALSNKVYVSCKEKNNVFLYHTTNGSCVISNLPEAIELINKIHEPKNIGVVDIDFDIINENLICFINELKSKEMLTLLNKGDCNHKPVSFLPILNLQNDVDKYIKNNESFLIGKNISHYLRRVVIHINETCKQECSNCSTNHLQTICCNKNVLGRYIPIDIINELIKQLYETQTKIVDIVGGDVTNYPYFSKLINIIQSNTNFCWRIWNHIDNYDDTINWGENVRKEIILTYPYDFEKIKSIYKNKNVYLNFLVGDDYNLYETTTIVKEIGLKQYSITPIYTGNNIDFFEKNVFLDKKDIFSNIISMREIFCHQKVNTNYFGTLEFYVDGSVRANTNTPIIGSFPESNVLELIYRELLINTAWRKIRDGEICSNCNYNYLCPSPSNYELIIGKENLCNTK